MPDLSKHFNKAKKAARALAIDAGLVTPSPFEELKRDAKDLAKKVKKGVKGTAKDVRDELGMPSSFGEKVEEAAKSALESFGVKEPRVGKSLLDVVKGAFSMIAALTGPEAKQEKALEKFNKSCENFVKAMKGLFKTKNQEHDRKEAKSTPKDASVKHVAKAKDKVVAPSKVVAKAHANKKSGWGL